MRIVILDGYALNPGDLDDSGLRELGEVVFHERCAPENLLEFAAGADAVLLNKVVLGEREFAQLPDLRYVGVQATGYNLIDTQAATRHGVTVTNVPAYSTDSVAQLTFAHLLNLAFRLGPHASDIREGRWTRNPDFTYWDAPLVELAGKTLGLLGFGNIAKKVANIALALGMRVIATRNHGTGNDGLPVEMVSLDEIFARSDVVSLHCPATEKTLQLVNSKRLAMMKSTAFLINTARGVLVDEVALANALNSGQIAGAGLDVLSVEPPTADNPLLTAKNCFLTPHFAWATLEARRRCQNIVIENLKAFLAGNPVNVVNS